MSDTTQDSIGNPPKTNRGIVGFLYGIAGFIAALTALLAVVRQQLPQIYELLELALKAKERVVWYGVYRDYSIERQEAVKLGETLKLATFGNTLVGESSETPTPGGPTNGFSWKIRGKSFEDGKVMILQYEMSSTSPWGRGYYILKRSETDARVYLGQWFGMDSKSKQFVCFPYVLSQYVGGVTSAEISNHLSRPGLNDGVVVR